jgi:hypothetical protein
MSESAFEAYEVGGDEGLIQYMELNGTVTYEKGDYVQVFLDRLRELAFDRDISDLMLLEIALRLGSVDSAGSPRAQGDYTWAVDGKVLYKKPEEVSDGQLMKMIQHISLELNSQKVSPATPIGAVAATSISEPIYQAQMRTFHYAGVLTKSVDPFDVLNKQVSNTVDHENSELIVALKPEFSNRREAFRLAESLKRGKLKTYAGFVKYDPIYHEALANDQIAVIDAEIDAFLGGSEFFIEYEEKLTRAGGLDIQKKSKVVPLKDLSMFDKKLFEKISKFRDERMFKKLNVMELKKRKAFLGPDFNQKTDIYSVNYTSEYQELLDKRKSVQETFLKAVIEAGGGSSYLIYLLHEVDEHAAEDWEQVLTPGDLYKIVKRQIKASDGRFRQVKAFPGLFDQADVEPTDVVVGGIKRPAVLLKFPYLTSRLDLSLQSIFPELEFCRGHLGGKRCHEPSTIAKLVNKQAKSQKVTIEDEDWDNQSPIDSYTMEIVKQSLAEAGILTNPDHDTESDTTGLVEIDMSESEHFDFEIAELGRDLRKCKKCGGGWYNVAVTPMVFDYDNLEEKKEYVVNFGDLTKSSVGSDNVKENAGDIPATVYADMVRYPGFSSPGQHHDYPLHTMHSGQIPCDPLPNEWFLKIMVDDVNDGRNNTFRGHLETARSAEFADFNRCNSNNLREIELVLGIEAARYTLLHGLAGGQSSTVNYKHYMLLADTMTNGISIKTASAGSSSVRGTASEKGNRTVMKKFPTDAPDEVIIDALAAFGQAPPMDDGGLRRESALLMLDLANSENYGSVLAQAYERQSQVVLRRAVQGLVDDLGAPNSAQIVGIPVRSGTQGGATKGRYGRPNLDAVIELIDDYLVTSNKTSLNKLETILKGKVPTDFFLLFKGEMRNVQNAMDRISIENTGYYWWPTEERDGIGDITQLKVNLAGKRRIGLPTQRLDEQIEMYDSMLQDESFAQAFDRYRVLSKSLEIVRRIYGLDQ